MTYSEQERTAYAHMQARLVNLLLRHDESHFPRYFAIRHTPESERDAALEPYRQLGAIFLLRDELFAHILPRIIRRLSFATPRATTIEEPPPRGRVDWERTLTATWDERPGEPPLHLHTRQRRRDFATPENLLTVVTLLAYRADTHRLLWDEHAAIGADALRHPLNDIIARCDRELAFPQLASLRNAAQHIIDDDRAATLETHVNERLIPGSNSAYQELLAWRQRYRALPLLQRNERTRTDNVLGADPERDNYLYQLWLFYELIDLLTREHALHTWDRADASITYHWSTGDDQRTYRLRYDRALPIIWHAAPGVRPDFIITHADPHTLHDDAGTQIWHEPGYILDAKYYRPHGDDPTIPPDPIKRMIADLHLTGERRGALLFAFHGSAPTAHADDHARTAPAAHKAQIVAPDIAITSHRIPPQGADDAHAPADILRALLDNIHTHLRQRTPIRCHGIFLDTLSANAHGALTDAAALTTRDGTPQHTDPSDLLLCPKPHIAPWRIDLVSLTHDCCTNAARCHIKHQPGVHKPRRLTLLEDISAALAAHPDAHDDDENTTAAATAHVLRITQRYAQLLQPRIETYRAWIRTTLDIGDHFDTTPLLTDAHRETLALARFLWEQIDHINATNYAGPTLLFTGVLEDITHTTLYRCAPPLCTAEGKELPKTLGTLGHSKRHGGDNWRILEDTIANAGHWHEHITPHHQLTLSAWIDDVYTISFIRNDAAHRANVPPATFEKLTKRYFGSVGTGMGLLNGIILAWRD